MTKEEAMDKITKLLALAKADGPEGAAANNKALELMKEHKITVQDLVGYATPTPTPSTVSSYAPEVLLKELLAVVVPSLSGLVDPGALGAPEQIKKKLIWCAEGGMVKRWVAYLADYVCEAYDCVMWRNNGLWAAGSESNLKNAFNTLEALVGKLNEEAKEEAKRRADAKIGEHSSQQLKWLQSWRLGRVAEIGQELVSAREAGKTLMETMFGGERARVQAWVDKNVAFEEDA